MRVAFLTHEPFYPPSGGGSAAAMYLVQALTRRGHQVEIFAPQPADPEGVARRFGVRLHPFTRWRMGRTTPLRTFKYLAYPAALARDVERVLSRGPAFDVVLAQHSIAAVAAGRLKQRHGLPILLNLLDCLTGFTETWPAWKMPRPLARALVRYELSLPTRTRADAVLTVSEALRERILAQGFPADRALTLQYGYDARVFRRSADLPPPSPTPLVVMHGSFDHHHLGPIARDAVISIARARRDVAFRFVGPLTPALRDCLRSARAQFPHIRSQETGFVPYAEIPSRLAEAWVGITPYELSTGTHCAFVAKTVEYLALGLPVVSTPLDSALRYYTGLPGVRFSHTNGAGFATAVLDWIRQTPEARLAATESARRKIETELDWPTLGDRAVEFLEARIQPRAAPARAA